MTLCRLSAVKHQFLLRFNVVFRNPWQRNALELGRPHGRDRACCISPLPFWAAEAFAARLRSPGFGGGSPEHWVSPDGFGGGCSCKEEPLGVCIPLALVPEESLKPQSIISL